jgi:hypothetical protein
LADGFIAEVENAVARIAAAPQQFQWSTEMSAAPGAGVFRTRCSFGLSAAHCK